MRVKKETTKPEIIIIKEGNGTNVELFEKLSPKEARVYFSTITEGVSGHKTKILKYSHTKFYVVEETIKYGVSINFKKYKRSSTTRCLIVNNNKIYLKSPKVPRPVGYGPLNSLEQKAVFEAFPFLLFLKEHNLDITFNQVFAHKLFTPKKVIAYLYKTQYTEKLQSLYNIRFLIKDEDYGAKTGQALITKRVKMIRNLQNINLDLLKEGDLLKDTIKMAETLCRTIDASWSVSRLKEEHDSLSHEITNIIARVNDRDLKVRDVFRDADKFIEGLITTMAELSKEGLIQKHCVATYGGKVDSGSCAIYHVNGYTLQLQESINAYYVNMEEPDQEAIDFNNNMGITPEIWPTKLVSKPFPGLAIQQFRGKSNISALEEWLTFFAINYWKQGNNDRLHFGTFRYL